MSRLLVAAAVLATLVLAVVAWLVRVPSSLEAVRRPLVSAAERGRPSPAPRVEATPVALGSEPLPQPGWAERLAERVAPKVRGARLRDRELTLEVLLGLAEATRGTGEARGVAFEASSLARLRAHADEHAAGSDRRAGLILASVWVDAFDSRHDQWLLRIAGAAEGERERDAFAAVHALSLAGRGGALGKLVRGILDGAGAAWSAEFAESASARVRLALAGIDRVPLEAWGELFETWLDPTAGGRALRAELWGLAARSAPERWAEPARRALATGDSAARRALAQLEGDTLDASWPPPDGRLPDDDTLSALLESLVRDARPQSFESVRLALSNERTRSAALDALGSFEPRRHAFATTVSGLLAWIGRLDADPRARDVLEDRLLDRWRRARTLLPEAARLECQAAFEALVAELESGSRSATLIEQMLDDLER